MKKIFKKLVEIDNSKVDLGVAISGIATGIAVSNVAAQNLKGENKQFAPTIGIITGGVYIYAFQKIKTKISNAYKKALEEIESEELDEDSSDEELDESNVILDSEGVNLDELTLEQLEPSGDEMALFISRNRGELKQNEDGSFDFDDEVFRQFIIDLRREVI